MKLKDADLEAILLRVTKYKLPTRIVASQFKISQRRVQQIVRLSNIQVNHPSTSSLEEGLMQSTLWT